MGVSFIEKDHQGQSLNFPYNEFWTSVVRSRSFPLQYFNLVLAAIASQSPF